MKADSGLAWEVLRGKEEGDRPAGRDRVEVRYTGWLPDGRIFDSSHARGDTATFPLDRVITGWTEGLQKMRVGEMYLFHIPAKLAYGSRPPPGSIIPRDSDLLFLVELVRIVK